MSNSYTSGTINIPNVTGNIVITATATAATVTSISAVFNQGQNIIYNTDSLDSLKQYLTVTATYTGGETAIVTGYTLSGTLTAGTSTITVSYSGKTTTFNVTVSTLRVLTISDIATHVGCNVTVTQEGIISMSNQQNFFVVALNSSIKRIRGIAISKYSVASEIKYGPKYIFEGPDNNNYYGISHGDPNSPSTSPTQIYQFVNATTKYTVTKLTNYTTFTPSDWIPLEQTGVWDYDANFEVALVDGDMIITNLDTGSVATIENANVIGFWGSSYADACWLHHIQVVE